MKGSIPIEQLILEADRIGVRLEIIAGLPVWEASPVYRHQAEADRIRASIKLLEGSDCTCHHTADTLFKFKDGSLNRPDIAVLCRLPSEEEMDVALTQVPEAVIEIVSDGYEDKDLKLAPSFYLSQGVKDVLILEPKTRIVWHPC